MAHEENDDTQPENYLEMEADVAYAWQYYEEIEYQQRLAASFPVDADVIFAQNWLENHESVKPKSVQFAGGRVCDCGHRDVQHISSNFCDMCNCTGFTTPQLRWEEACRPW